MQKLLLALVCASAALTAQAAVVSSLPGGTVLDMPSGTFDEAHVFGPQTLSDGVTWQSDSETQLFGYAGHYGFNLNGYWSGLPMAAANDASSKMQLAFAKPVGAVGALFNYSPNLGNATIAVYDANHVLIESTVLQIALPSDSVNQGVFYGFRASSANISYFEMSGAFIGAANFTVAAVPEPATYGMLLAGLGMLGLLARRRRH